MQLIRLIRRRLIRSLMPTTEPLSMETAIPPQSEESIAGIISTGANESGAKKIGDWQQVHADQFYEEVRHRTTDAKKIADNTMFTEKAVEEIKLHMFFKEHDLGGGRMGRFTADFDQAQAWDKLTQGKHTDMDILLLKHEYVELAQMRLHGYNYPDAHDIANKYHDWASKVKGAGK